MYKDEITIRVRYAETDQMGFVYYGKYAEYFEVARVESLRNLGVNYKELESKGIWLPVLNYSIDFIKPATYDDELLIVTTIPVLPAARILFTYECRNNKDELICKAKTELVFLDASSKRPMRCPMEIQQKLSGYFA
jgi:acyl-CoA thioester hydrolase